MCTLIALHRIHEVPLVVAANRDEFYARPSEPPQVLRESPRVVAGRDVTSGGTWLGATSDGLFVGLTNQRAWNGYTPKDRSRGEVVLDALSRGNVEEVDRYLDGLDARLYAGFNLLYGDGRLLRVAYARPSARTIERRDLPPGIHVLANDRMGSPDFPKVPRVLPKVEALRERPWPLVADALEEVLADRSMPPLEQVPSPPEGAMFDHALTQKLQALCIHTPLYGTVSATILGIDGGVRLHRYADGPPSETSFDDVTHLHHGAASRGSLG